LKENWRNTDAMVVAKLMLEAACPSDRHLLEAWPPPYQPKPRASAAIGQGEGVHA
jgi:hypothetical protein